MDMAAMSSPVEDQISEVRQSHGERFRQAGLRVGEPDPKPGLTSLLNDGRAGYCRGWWSRVPQCL